jgi:ribosomal protein L13E
MASALAWPSQQQNLKKFVAIPLAVQRQAYWAQIRSQPWAALVSAPESLPLGIWGNAARTGRGFPSKEVHSAILT